MDTTQNKEAINKLKEQKIAVDSEISHLKIDLDVANSRLAWTNLGEFGSIAVLLAGGPIGWVGFVGGQAYEWRLKRKIRHLEAEIAGKGKQQQLADQHMVELKEELRKASIHG